MQNYLFVVTDINGNEKHFFFDIEIDTNSWNDSENKWTCSDYGIVFNADSIEDAKEKLLKKYYLNSNMLSVTGYSDNHSHAA